MDRAERVGLLTTVDPRGDGGWSVRGRTLTPEEVAVLEGCVAEEYDEAAELVSAMLDVAIRRLQPDGVPLGQSRAAFALGLGPDRIGEFAQLLARQDALRQRAAQKR